MGPNLIALAVPVFFAAIGAELLVSRRRRQSVYRFADTLADLGCGVAQRVMLLLFGAALVAGYALVYRHVRLVTFPEGSPWPWVVAIVGVDLAYYVWHRLSHEVNFLWAAHVVHHQSEDYNLAVALRQAVATSVTVMPFYLPLAVLGVPPVQFLVVDALSTLYQFWIHTELVGPIRWLDPVVNTPSLHRVHHAVNTRYLDRNYAAVLMLWDRLFGTYEPETERAVYGIRHPLRSFNPIWAQIQPWRELFGTARRAPSFREGWQLLWTSPARPPAWLQQPEGLRGLSGAPEPRFEVQTPPAARIYAGVQFAILAVGVFFLLLLGERLTWNWRVAAVALVLLSLLALSAIVEGHRWGRWLEAARWTAVLAVSAAWMLGLPRLITLAASR